MTASISTHLSLLHHPRIHICYVSCRRLLTKYEQTLSAKLEGSLTGSYPGLVFSSSPPEFSCKTGAGDRDSIDS
jgi:hypothetical protein